MRNRDRILVGVLACVVAVAGFWFLALKPKRAEVTAASSRAAEAQTKLATANSALATATTARKSFETDYATIARLGKAVPDDDDAASLVFQLETAARKAGIDFRSLEVGGSGAAATPAPSSSSSSASSSGSKDSPSSSGSSSSSSTPPTSGSASTGTAAGSAGTAGAATGTSTMPPGVVAGTDGMNRLPFTFVFDGDYFALTRLLDLVRSFTTAKGEAVTVRGRLMTVESVNLQEGRNGFPEVKATVNATAYLAAEPIQLPGGVTPPAATNGTTPAPATAPATQAAGGAKSTVPTATAIPGALK